MISSVRDLRPLSAKEQQQKRKTIKKGRERFAQARKAETEYARTLRQVAKQVGHIVKGFAPSGVVTNVEELMNVLDRYASLLKPWARSVAKRMLTEVGRRDAQAWNEHAAEMGRVMREEIENAPVGQVLQEYLEEQVRLITSLPTEAGQRVHKLTREAMYESTRASEIAKEIMRSGEVTASRANTIARTEVARTASALTMARATAVGSTHYVWRTAGDGDVRSSHKHMAGKIIAWDDPPTLDDGTVTHAGMIYNCRCYPEPILPDEVE